MIPKHSRHKKTPVKAFFIIPCASLNCCPISFQRVYQSVHLGVVVLPYRGLYRLGCLFEFLMAFGVLAVFIIAVGFASWCASGLPPWILHRPVRHGWTLARLTRGSGLCVALWGITGIFHRSVIRWLPVVRSSWPDLREPLLIRRYLPC